MPWTRPTLVELYDRMKADTETRVTSGTPFTRFSLLGIMNLVFTGAIYLSYGFLVWLAKQLLPDTAETIGLDRWANILGIPKKAAAFTTGLVVIQGTISHVIAAGEVIFEANGLEYTTDIELTIGGGGSVQGYVTAIAEGEDYNTTETNFELQSPDVDVTTISYVSGFDDGQDEETDPDLLIRILQRLQNPPSSGTRADYVRWALEVTGVGKAWCLAAAEWAGAGTLAVVVSDEDLLPVSGSVLTNVETHIDAEKPIPAAASYINAVEQQIDFFISIDPNTAENQAAIDDNLTDVFLAESEPGGTVLLTHLNAAIQAGLVNDYEITGINKDGNPAGVVDVTSVFPKVSSFHNSTYSSL